MGDLTPNDFQILKLTLDAMTEAVIVVTANDRIRYLNPAARRLTGVESAMAGGRRFHRVVRLVDATTVSRIRRTADLPIDDEPRGHLSPAPYYLYGADNRRIAVDVSVARPAQPEPDLGAVLVLRDASEAHEQWQRMHHLATHDGLTGLVNRVEFERRLTNVLRRLSGESSHALLYMDLDRFKAVNDTCGHAAGDELLREVTQMFRAHVRKRDTLARLGGDEFVLLMEHCPLDKAARMARTLASDLAKLEFRWGRHRLRVGVSIGVVAIPTGDVDIRTLMAAADAACYTAKREGRIRIAPTTAFDDHAAALQPELLSHDRTISASHWAACAEAHRLIASMMRSVRAGRSHSCATRARVRPADDRSRRRSQKTEAGTTASSVR